MISFLGMVLLSTSFAADLNPAPAVQNAKKAPSVKSKSTKLRSIEDLVALARKLNFAGDIADVEYAPLGFPKEYRTKDLVYQLSPKPSLHECSMEIVQDDASKEIALVWRDERTTGTDANVTTAVWFYVSDLKGNLQRVAYGFADEKDADLSPKPIDKSVKDAYAKLVAFFRKDAAALDPITQ
jgi:hypothetical protein